MDLTKEEFDQLSPMMQHYIRTREENPGCILFYRLGDFYEMFFDDAQLVSKELELTLTGKSCGLKERAPMCGVPFHAAGTYISRLVSRGRRGGIPGDGAPCRSEEGLARRTPGRGFLGSAFLCAASDALR